jgi:hypothetical protein
VRRAALTLAALALLTGCGDSGDEVRYLNEPLLMPLAQVERTPAGSPERTVLEWGRAVLYSDAVTAARAYDPALGVTARALAEQREGLESTVSRVKSARIADVEREGRRATVVAHLTLSSDDPDQDHFIALVFELKRLDDRWALATRLPTPTAP